MSTVDDSLHSLRDDVKKLREFLALAERREDSYRAVAEVAMEVTEAEYDVLPGALRRLKHERDAARAACATMYEALMWMARRGLANLDNLETAALIDRALAAAKL